MTDKPDTSPGSHKHGDSPHAQCTEDHVHGPGCQAGSGGQAPSPEDRPSPGDGSSRALAGALASSFAILKWVMAGLVVAFLLSNLKVVGPEERGVILRFGRPVGEGQDVLIPPGPKLAWPFPIDEFQRVPISRLQQVSSTVGWYYTTTAAEITGQEAPPEGSLDPIADGYALTGDANIVHIRATLSYRIADPARYLFAFEHAPSLLTNALNNAILHAAAQSPVSNLLTGGLGEFGARISARLATLIQEQSLGVTVDAVTPTVVVPRQVRQFFDQVLEENTRSQQLVTEARTDADLRVRQAESSAKSIRFAAGTQRTTDLIQLTNEVQRFRILLKDYEKSPDLLRRRYLSELIQRSAPGVDNKFMIQESMDGSRQEIRLLLNRDETLAKPTNPQEPDDNADDH